jgi:hypothetical protein
MDTKVKAEGRFSVTITVPSVALAFMPFETVTV